MAQREQKAIMVGDKEYIITQLDGRTGLKLLKKIQAIVTPAAIGAASGDGGFDLGRLILDVSEGLEKFDEDDIFRSVAVSLSWNEDKVANTFTGGNLAALMELFLQIIVFNFNDVFLKLGFDLEQILKDMAQAQTVVSPE